jgi:Recombinase
LAASARSSLQATKGDKVADQLRARGVRGVLVQMAERGQIIELRCEMPMCYCDEGREHFDKKSHPPTAWAPSPDHYPRLKADGGHLVPWNVRLSHVLCNRMDYGWRMRIRTMLEKGMSLEKIADELTQKGIPRPHKRQKWSPEAVRRAFVS